MFLQVPILLAASALLYWGSAILVQGSASTAAMFAVRPVVIGLTIVSLATSAPELLVSFMAAMKGSEGISLGNILGSNVINIALVLGISAAIRPVSVQSRVVRVEIPYMIFVSVAFWLLCLDNRIGRMDGILLFFLLGVFLIYGMMTAKEKSQEEHTATSLQWKPLVKNAGLIISGVILLTLGANYVIKSAVEVALFFGLSQTFIGISVVALGTSLPELATSAVAAARGESDISVGNVVGSNLFNICLVMGAVGFFNPMTVEPSLHRFQFPFMIFVTFTLGIMGVMQKGVGRIAGFFFIAMFFLYIWVSYLN
ncbi:MAG: calcium/sodium antiporter [Desulfobacterales bacterium]|nr:calcium/sodium antiporter [Desulfobacterales bacterium]